MPKGILRELAIGEKLCGDDIDGDAYCVGGNAQLLSI